MNVATLIPRPAAVRHVVGGIVRQQLNASLWRVSRQSGDILGYVELLDDTAGRMRAKRMTPDRRGFILAGEFSNVDEAVDALRR